MADWNGFKKNGTTYIPNDATARAGVIATTQLIKDTVGWSGKNKLKYPYINSFPFSNRGVTFSGYDGKGKINVNGTNDNTDNSNCPLLGFWGSTVVRLPAGRYYVSNGTDNSNINIAVCYNTTILYQGTGGVVDAPNGISYINFYVVKGATINNEVCSPIIMDADILDRTYEPYFGSTAFPRSEQAELGAKNLAPINATTVTNKGITLTVDENKIITINGTATEAVGFEISKRGQWLKNGERYKLSGCKGGAADKYKLDIAYTDTGFLAINYDQDEVEFTANNARNYVMRIVVYAGQTMNNVVIKPMVRLATDTDPTFAPPAMTNKELTEKVASRVIFKTLSGGDLDDILTTGWYSWGGTAPAHSPQGVAYSCMQCIVETGVQKQIVYFGADVIYMRQRSGSPATWGSWYKFQGTVVS